MKVADGVTKAGWKPVVLFIPAFLLIFLVPSILGALGFDRIIALSGGLVTNTLANTWIGTILTVGLIALWYGSLDLSDLGVVRDKLPSAVGVTVLVWSIFTIAQIVVAFATDNFSLYYEWVESGVTETLGKAIGYYFGNVVFEELAFRGFLMVQLYLLLDGEWWQENDLVRITAAVGGSSLVFTLFHVPAFIAGGIELAVLGNIFLYTVLLCLVYLRTRNIFMAMGLHGLANFPIPVFAVAETTPIDFSLVWAVPAAIIVLTWPKLSQLSG